MWEKIAMLTLSGITNLQQCATEAFKVTYKFSISLETPKFKTFPRSSYSVPRSKISWHFRKFEDNQWHFRSRIQTPSVFGSSPSITTWLRRPTALISLTVPSKVLSTFTLKRRRLILLFYCNLFECLTLGIEF